MESIEMGLEKKRTKEKKQQNGSDLSRRQDIRCSILKQFTRKTRFNSIKIVDVLAA